MSLISILRIPSITLVHIMGKDIRKLANMGTLFALNQIRAIRITDITGVDLMMTRNGSSNLLKILLKPAAKPTAVPNKNESMKPIMPLWREERIIIKNSLVLTRLYKLIIVLSGEGKIIDELIIKEINFQIIIKDNIEINVSRLFLLVVKIFIRYLSTNIFRRKFKQDFNIILNTFFCGTGICKSYIASWYCHFCCFCIHPDFKFFNK